LLKNIIVEGFMKVNRGSSGDSDRVFGLINSGVNGGKAESFDSKSTHDSIPAPRRSKDASINERPRNGASRLNEAGGLALKCVTVGAAAFTAGDLVGMVLYSVNQVLK
jgi:hypothetical protein